MLVLYIVIFQGGPILEMGAEGKISRPMAGES